MRNARRGLGGVYLRGGVWWVRYSFRGRKVRETSGSGNRADAVRLLKRRLGETGAGRLVGPDAERGTLADLRRMVLDDYQLQGTGRRSGPSSASPAWSVTSARPRGRSTSRPTP